MREDSLVAEAREHDGSVRATLRARTRELHARLHAHALLVPFVEGTVTAADCRRVTAAFHGFYTAFEPRLVTAAERLAVPVLYSSCLRTAWLEEDLRELGSSRVGIGSLPRPKAPAEPTTLAELAGCLYVVEGSALGGQTILQSLRESQTGACPPLRFHFLRAHGTGTVHRWRRVCRFLEEACRAGDRESAIRAARGTFVGLSDWLDEVVRRQIATA